MKIQPIHKIQDRTPTKNCPKVRVKAKGFKEIFEQERKKLNNE